MFRGDNAKFTKTLKNGTGAAFGAKKTKIYEFWSHNGRKKEDTKRDTFLEPFCQFWDHFGARLGTFWGMCWVCFGMCLFNFGYVCFCFLMRLYCFYVFLGVC